MSASPVIIGVGGPVGSGKTKLLEDLCAVMAKDFSIGVITNDIYTKIDAEYMRQNSVLDDDRIIGVETGGCPHPDGRAWSGWRRRWPGAA